MDGPDGGNTMGEQRRMGRTLTGIGLLATVLAACGPSPGLMATSMPQAQTAAASRPAGARIVIKYKTPPAKPAGMAQIQAADAQPLSTMGFDVVTVPAGSDPQATLRRLSQDPNIESAELTQRMARPRTPKRSQPVEILATTFGSGSGRDPLRNQQWGLDKVEADAAWKVTRGAPNVVVAVVDSGVDPNHPDLRDKLVPGWSAIGGSHNIKDEDGHGTHCAGVATAIAGNGMGISGIAPNVKLMPIRVLDAKGEGEDKDIAAGVIWASNHGASVISMSVGSLSASRVLKDAIAYAQKKNVLVVAAMGNDGNNKPNFPAQYKGVMAVGATDAKDNLAEFSNTGNWISVTAPGVDILSTMPTYRVTSNEDGTSQGYAKEDGTSMATPLVAGLAALVRSRWPELSAEQVRQTIEATATDLGPKGVDTRFGHGRINARRALLGM
jgi:type VII secretion-associated serine protease mycosin